VTDSVDPARTAVGFPLARRRAARANGSCTLARVHCEGPSMTANDLHAAATLTAALIKQQQRTTDADAAAKLFYQVIEALKRNKPADTTYQNLFV